MQHFFNPLWSSINVFIDWETSNLKVWAGWAVYSGEERNSPWENLAKAPPTPHHKNESPSTAQDDFGCCTILQSNHMTKYVKHESTQQNQMASNWQDNTDRPRDVQTGKTNLNICHIVNLVTGWKRPQAIRITSYSLDACGKGSVCT